MKRVTDLEAKGEIEKAIEELNRARKTFPEDGNLLNHLGDLYIRVNKIKEAVEVYELGVVAYRNDTFYRNAIGLGKKILRHAPDHIEMYRIVGELLIELGQRGDAAVYYLNYLEKLESAGRIKEAVETCKSVLGMGMSDPRLLKKIDEIYLAAGLKEKKKIDVKEVIRLKDTPPPKETLPEEKIEEKEKPTVEKSTIAKEERRFEPEIQVPVKAQRAEGLSADVAGVLEKAITNFSENQKSIINLFQGSLERQIGNLTQIIDDLKTSSHTYTRETEKIISTLANSVNNFIEKQEKALLFLADNIRSSSEKLVENIQESINQLGTETRRYSIDTKNAYEDLSTKFENSFNELNKTTQALNIGLSESKNAVSKLETFLIDHFLRQTAEEKKRQGLNRLFIILVTAGLFIIAILLLILVIKG
ncbi:MAG: hypothetical protein ABIL05_03760 [candidate division WOR-3 bacterium]